MYKIRKFEQLSVYLSKQEIRRKVAVVWASDEETQTSIFKAIEVGFARVVFVGCKEKVSRHDRFESLQEFCEFETAETPEDAARKAVKLVREGKADVLMKGLLNTDIFLKAVLDKQSGILRKGAVMTHVSCAELPTYPKLLFFSDAAVIPYPNQEQRIEQVNQIVRICRSFGISIPKVALNHCSEKVNKKLFPFTEEYLSIKEMAKQGRWGDCIVDGPLDVRTSCDREALIHKGIISPINGEADAIIFPDIEVGNAFYKTITYFANAEVACMLVGATVPVVLTSRSDSSDAKYNSLALAIVYTGIG